MLRTPTYSAKPKDVKRQWYLVDASSAPLGRLATEVARRLQGKHKPGYTAHIDVGDNVVVINAAKLKVTGNKKSQKTYYRHSQYPGGLSETTLEEQLKKDARKVIVSAVKGMLPKNKLQEPRLLRLRVYTDAEHEQTAQQPQELEIK
jgi:large subunit ribosomal protein L13